MYTACPVLRGFHSEPTDASPSPTWHGHVWMAPALQGFCDCDSETVACGHVSGLVARLDSRRP
jgi:hypothetical protein